MYFAGCRDFWHFGSTGKQRGCWKVQKALRQRKEPSLRRVVKEVYVLWRGDLRLVSEYQYVMPKVLYSLKYNPSTLK